MDELLALMEEAEEEAAAAATAAEEEKDAGLDDLASLWDDDDDDDASPDNSEPIPKRKLSSSSSRTNNTSPNPNPQRRSAAPVSPSDTSHSANGSQQPKKKKKNIKPVDIGLDDKLGIRMINRKISSVDMIDLISTNPYRTPATLSAMCLQNLAKLLQDPPQIIDRATVSGKMLVVSVGIVFSNTGTRFSKRGSAFCIMTIGSFVSGPCATVMLFGDAYSKYCKSAQPGMVVALLGPRLMPPKEGSGSYNDDTAITFSCTDIEEFKLVGTARDYGTCKFTGVRKKQPNGQWTATGKCQNYVDIRVCEFCEKHKNKGKTAGGSAGGVRSGQMNKMQKLKLEHRQSATKSMNTNRFGLQSNQLANNVHCRPTGSSIHGGTATRSLSAAVSTWSDDDDVAQRRNNLLPNVPMQMKREKLPPSNSQQGQTTRNRGITPNSTNRLLNGQGRNGNSKGNACVSKKRNDYPVSSSTNRLLVNTNNSHGGRGGNRFHNPYGKKSPPSQQAAESKRPTGDSNDKSSSSRKEQQQHKTKQKTRILGDILKMPQSNNKKRKQVPSTSLAKSVASRSSHQQKKKRINTDCGGFDGSVPVPKPNSLFARGGVAASATTVGRATTAKTSLQQEPPKEQILQKQADLAKKLRGQQQQRAQPKEAGSGGGTSNKKRTSTKAVDSSSSASSSNNNKSFFDTLDDDNLDTEKIVNARSRFHTEADAEEYAKRRGKLVEWEKEEASKTAISTKNDKENNNRIHKEWHCRTCQNSYDKYPSGCYQNRHEVRRLREISKSRSKSEQRSLLNKKGPSDGGLQLAQGLDWRAVTKY